MVKDREARYKREPENRGQEKQPLACRQSGIVVVVGSHRAASGRNENRLAVNSTDFGIDGKATLSEPGDRGRLFRSGSLRGRSALADLGRGFRAGFPILP